MAEAALYEIAQEFCHAPLAFHDRLSGGQVNSTYKVTDTNGQSAIIQKMGATLDPGITEDYAVVADHLAQDGWEVPLALRTPSDELIITDTSGGNWRGFAFIESDAHPPRANMEAYIAFGSLLGRLALSLHTLDYDPQHAIPNFHNAQFYAGILALRMDAMDGAGQDFSARLLSAIEKEPPITGEPSVIHGDPKLNNALYRHGKPFTLIDWDTLMKGSPMLDLADMLRSVTGSLRDADPNLDPTQLQPIIEAYRQAAEVDDSSTSFAGSAVSATRRMCLTLATRYMIDSVDGSYFQWDQAKYPDLATQNTSNAVRQWGNYQALLKG